MTTFANVQNHLRFLNTGTAQTPGLIVMELTTTAPSTLGSRGNPFGHIVVVFNATNTAQTFAAPALTGIRLRLHPILESSSDPVVRSSTFDPKSGTAIVPALTTAVFVSPE